MVQVTREFIRERGLHTSRLTGDGNQINFIRMCNAYAEKLGKAMPRDITDEEMQKVFVTLTMPAEVDPFGLRVTFGRFSSYEREGCAELIGCYLAIRRGERKT